jgi:hypothetical protein
MLLLGTAPWFVQRYLDESAWRALETAKRERDAALVVWRKIYANFQHGDVPPSAESAARERYFAARKRVESALTTLETRYQDKPGGLERAAKNRRLQTAKSQ